MLTSNTVPRPESVPEGKGKKEVRLSLFRGDMIMYVENLKEKQEHY